VNDITPNSTPNFNAGAPHPHNPTYLTHLQNHDYSTHPPKKKFPVGIALFIAGIGIFLLLLAGLSAWFIFSTFADHRQEASEITTPESYSALYQRIQRRLQNDSPMFIDNWLGGGSAIQFEDGTLLWIDFRNILEISDQALRSISRDKGIGYAQNPSQLINLSAGSEDYLLVQGTTTIYISRIGDGATKESVAAIEFEALRDVSGGDSIVAMFLAEDHLTVIKSPPLTPHGQVPTGNTTAEDIEGMGWDHAIAIDPTFTTVQIFDISTPSNPRMIDNYIISGTYSGSRMLGTKLYISTNHGVFDPELLSEDRPETFLPHVFNAGNTNITPLENIRVAPGGAWDFTTVYTQLTGIDVVGSTTLVSQAAFLGNFNDIAAIADGIVLVIDNHEFLRSFDQDMTQTSFFIQISLDEGTVDFTQVAEVPGSSGTLLEYEGLLYLISDISFSAARGAHSWSGHTPIQVLVLDENLEVIGQFKDDTLTFDDMQPMAFMGNYLYLVNFGFGGGINESHVLDFTNPSAPELIRNIETPHLSSRVIPWPYCESDQTVKHWLQLDSDFDERSRHVGDKLIMFDQSNPLQVQEIHSILLEDMHVSDARSYSGLIITDPATGIIAFPSETSYLIFSYDNDDGFEKVAEIELDIDLWNWDETAGAIVIGDNIFIVQFGRQIEILSYSLSDFSELGRLNLRD